MKTFTSSLSLSCLAAFMLIGCGATPHTHRIVDEGFEPTLVLEFETDSAGKLEPVETFDSSMWRFTTEGYELSIDIGMRTWIDRSKQPGYSVEQIDRPFGQGELVRYNNAEQNPQRPFRALMRWRETSIRPWVDAATEADRERGVEAMRSLRLTIEE